MQKARMCGTRQTSFRLIMCRPLQASSVSISFTNLSVDHNTDIYGFNKNVSKPEEFYSAFRVNKHAVNIFHTSSKEGHRRKRRTMAQAFSEAALRSYERFISIRVDEFVRKLNGWRAVEDGPSGKRPFNMAYEFNFLMLDIMGGLCFGEAFGFVAGKGDKVLSQAHERAFRIYMVWSNFQRDLVWLIVVTDRSQAITQAHIFRSRVLPSVASSSQRSWKLCSPLHIPPDCPASKRRGRYERQQPRRKRLRGHNVSSTRLW